MNVDVVDVVDVVVAEVGDETVSAASTEKVHGPLITIIMDNENAKIFSIDF